MTKILLVSADHVGPTMAGPGIRYFQFARELSKRFDVTLMVPPGSDAELDGITVVDAGDFRGRRFRRFARTFDAVVAQTLRAWTMRSLAASDVRVVYDLYDPLVIENLGFYASQDLPERVRRSGYRASALIQEISLATGDAFVCASERQRDMWLGALGSAGRFDPAAYARDPDLRALIDVVPFGLDADPPRSSGAVLKGVVDGIASSDRVLLWGGGIWNWFDPLTLIRAVAQIAERRDDVKLYFLGVKHPNPMVREMAMATRAVELARELEVLDRYVFFNFGWVPFEERGSYLLEADLGVSSHFDSVETRFAFRTRILDYLWAELPVVTTRGDVLADLVETNGLGRVVDYEDVEGWAAAIEGLLDDSAEYQRARERIGAVRAQFAWPRLAERLADLCVVDGRRVESGRGVGVLTAKYLWHGILALLLERGPRATLRQTLGILRRPRVP